LFVLIAYRSERYSRHHLPDT